MEALRMNELKHLLAADGVLVTTSGPHGNVVRMQPPLTARRKVLELFVRKFAKALEQVMKDCSSPFAFVPLDTAEPTEASGDGWLPRRGANQTGGVR